MFDFSVKWSVGPVEDISPKTYRLTIGSYSVELTGYELTIAAGIVGEINPVMAAMLLDLDDTDGVVTETGNGDAVKNARTIKKVVANLKDAITRAYRDAIENAAAEEFASPSCGPAGYKLIYGEPPRNRYTKQDAEDPAWLPPKQTRPAGYDKMLDPCKGCDGNACPVCWQGGEFSICDTLMKRLGYCADMARNEGADELADCYLSLWQVVKQARRLYELELNAAFDYANTLMHWVDTCMGELEPKLRGVVCDEDD